MIFNTGGLAMKMLACATALVLALAPSCGLAQTPKGQSPSDDELIKFALSAAPDAISKDAGVMAVEPDGKMRTLRKGSGQWTCMPGHADPANPDPMCGDKNAMEWAHAWMSHKPPSAKKLGSCTCCEGMAVQAIQTRMRPKKSRVTIGSRLAPT